MDCSITRLVISQSLRFLVLRAAKPAFFSGMFSETKVSEQLYYRQNRQDRKAEWEVRPDFEKTEPALPESSMQFIVMLMNILRRPFRYSFHSIVFYLIGITILVYLGQRRFPVLTYAMALDPRNIRVWQFVSYMFTHDPRGLSHILFNMLGLFMFGYQVERQMGSREFLMYYLVSGALAGLVSFALYCAAGTGTFLLGASGALFAVELAFAAFFPDALIYIWGIIPLRAPVMVLGYTGLQIFFLFTGLQRGVAHLTHLSGFAVGWLYFMVRFGINPWKAFRGR